MARARMESAEDEIERRTRRGAADWHAAWAFGLFFCALAWPAGDDLTLNYALFVAALPGLVGQLARLPRGGRVVRAMIAFSWPIAIGAAIAMTGGLAGPLAALALMPAAAAATLSGGRYIAIGAALTAATIAAIALAANAGLLRTPTPSGPWMPLVAVIFATIGLAAALQLAQAARRDELATQSRETTRLKTLLESGPFLLLCLDAEGVVREVFGGAPEDADLKLLGRSFETLAGEGDRAAARAALGIVRRTGQASVGFAPPLAPDRFLAVELRALQQGEAAALVRDASRERAFEAWLEQGKVEAEGMAMAKSRFLANMSHELRTPLNAIIGFSDIMRSRLFGPLEGRYAEYAALIHESGGHLLDLINDVLDMSKIEAERYDLSLEAFDAREAVAAALRLTRVQADTARIALRGALPPEPLEVNADRRALKQIVLNLVSNALKFTPTGGQVNVIARAHEDMLEIIVADTGVGIAPTDLERLGRPFEQAGGADQRAMGTGLGLSLVRAFAELHGGAMTIKSRLGEGTAVSIKLPVIDREAKPQGEADPLSPPPLAAAAGDNVIAFRPQR
ncbi:MAG TPA: HAMP domain-containing sensor histidine kinase [Caulobacteraceae bacterium]|nr:HAMP domain-containing sensor histidine kinase [Caulobacteraceae bacterium]